MTKKNGEHILLWVLLVFSFPVLCAISAFILPKIWYLIFGGALCLISIEIYYIIFLKSDVLNEKTDEVKALECKWYCIFIGPIFTSGLGLFSYNLFKTPSSSLLNIIACIIAWIGISIFVGVLIIGLFILIYYWFQLNKKLAKKIIRRRKRMIW